MNRYAYIVVGLGYGDEGKGTTTDFLTREHNAHTVIRYNGGPQAAHHVVTDDNLMHCFAQFGAGTLVPNTKTYLSQYMLVDPLALTKEAEVLKAKGIDDALPRLSIDKRCLIVTPFHKLVNRILETLRGAARHGSCGMGVGQTLAFYNILQNDALFAGDLSSPQIMREKLFKLFQLAKVTVNQALDHYGSNEAVDKYYQQLMRPNYIELIVDNYYNFTQNSKAHLVDEAYLPRLLNDQGTMIFEGAQGVLLDHKYGFHPHVTKTRTTAINAQKLLSGYQGTTETLGILRAYSTRHGAGPFVTEDKNLAEQIPDQHNSTNTWQEHFRVGWFDLLTAHYALKVADKIDRLVITNLDRIAQFEQIKICTGYQNQMKKIDEIKVNRHSDTDDLYHQTKYLNECQPIYKEIDNYISADKRESSLVKYLQQELNKEIALLSFGPRAKDKIKLC